MGRIVKSGQPCPDCGSSDGLAIYEDGSTYCYSANHQGRKDRQNGQASMTISTRMDSGVSMKEIPTFPIAGLSDRGITEQTAKSFGVRTSYDGNGQPEDYWFPLYKGGTLVGYQSKSALGCGERGAGKVRRHGDTKGTLPFGAHLFEERGKFLIVTEGAEDAMAARQMLLDRGKKWKVVASLGTDSWKRQLEYYENFDAVAIAFDMDEGGQKAAREFASALSPGKARLVEWNPKAKDPNDLLMKGAGGHFIKCINEAKEFQPDGLLVGDDMWSIIKDYKYPEYIPYPPEFEGLNHKMRGMRAGEISMWTAGTGIGKTVFLRRIKQHIIQNTDWSIGEVELEEMPAITGASMLEFQARKRMAEMTQEEKLKAYKETYGTGRIITLDHRSQYGKGQSLVGKFRHLVHAHGVRVIFLDHITLAVSEYGDGGGGLQQQDRMMADFLAFTEQTGAHLALVSHIRKSPSGSASWAEGAVPTEDDLKGSGSLAQIAFDIIAVSRNKQADDDYERDVSSLHVLKCRREGKTGFADRLYWNHESRSLEQAMEPEQEG